jgi:protein-disulfide isomerase
MANQNTRGLPAPSHYHQQVKLWQASILALVALVAAVIMLAKQTAAPANGSLQLTSNKPEIQLMQALDAQLPTLVFFHSLTCIACQEMIAVIGQVYPE